MYIPVKILFVALLLICFIPKHRLEENKNPYHNNFGSSSTICPETAECQDGTRNFLCDKNPKKPAHRCKRFRLIPMIRQTRLRMLNAHNGLRNKVAEDLKVANMNLLYWNVQLQSMAESYLCLCKLQRDTCLVIGSNASKVNQNTCFDSVRQATPKPYWTARTVRNWYLELGMLSPTFDGFLEAHAQGRVQNYTQLIWPTAEFIGCAGAIMFHGFFVVCYYYPPMRQTDIASEFIRSDDNTKCICPKERVMCSKTFTHLCGIDLQADNGADLVFSSGTLFLLCMVVSKLWKHLIIKRISFS